MTIFARKGGPISRPVNPVVNASVTLTGAEVVSSPGTLAVGTSSPAPAGTYIVHDFSEGYAPTYQNVIDNTSIGEQVNYFSGGPAGTTRTLSADLAVNGTFSADTDWTKGTGWAITGGKAVFTPGTGSVLSQTVTLVSGQNYELVYVVSDYVAGTVTPSVDGVSGTVSNSNGSKTKNIVAVSTSGDIAFTASSDFDGKIDGVVCKAKTTVSKPPSSAFSIAAGQGVGGTNALKITVPADVVGTERPLASFWLEHGIRVPSGIGTGNLATNTAILPDGQSANRLQIVFKYPDGFHEADAALLPPVYPNYDNFNIGTYVWDDNLAGCSGGNCGKESNNWHFYHRPYIRHDKANGGWITMTLNEVPDNQRAGAGASGSHVCWNPCTVGESTGLPVGGNYWEKVPRFYFSPTPYGGNPEIARPYDLLIDSVKLIQVDENKPMTITFQGHTEAEVVTIVATGGTTTKLVDLVNVSGRAISGRVTLCPAVTVTTRLYDDTVPRVELTDAAYTSTYQQLLSWAIGETRTFEVDLTPPASFGPATAYRTVGLMFVEDSQFNVDLSNTLVNNQSVSDTNIERRRRLGVGPHDAVVCGGMIQLKFSD